MDNCNCCVHLCSKFTTCIPGSANPILFFSLSKCLSQRPVENSKQSINQKSICSVLFWVLSDLSCPQEAYCPFGDAELTYKKKYRHILLMTAYICDIDDRSSEEKRSKICENDYVICIYIRKISHSMLNMVVHFLRTHL